METSNGNEDGKGECSLDCARTLGQGPRECKTKRAPDGLRHDIPDGHAKPSAQARSSRRPGGPEARGPVGQQRLLEACHAGPAPPLSCVAGANTSGFSLGFLLNTKTKIPLGKKNIQLKKKRKHGKLCKLCTG